MKMENEIGAREVLCLCKGCDKDPFNKFEKKKFPHVKKCKDPEVKKYGWF